MAEADEVLFDDAVQALREDDKGRAKHILTRLIKSDQNNADYWVWMSAAVETHKERVYCLEAALKVDPENSAAKQGLVLLGARPPETDVKPVQITRPRGWEDKIFLAYERPGERGLRGMVSSPVTRLTGVVLIGAVVVAGIAFAFLNPRTAIFRNGKFVLLGPSATPSPTATFFSPLPAIATPGQPTPLAVLLGISYTATPLYVDTPRPPGSANLFRAALAAYRQGDWVEYFRELKLLRKNEPNAADVPYFLGEGYRALGNCSDSVAYYNDSLKVDSHFAPSYLGLARARLCIEPDADVTDLYNLALRSDPEYGEIYLDRANFYLDRKDLKKAMPDLERALRLMPDSALVQVAYARAYMLAGDTAKALDAARKANKIDLTLLSAYYYLGQALIKDGQYADAIRPLEIYLLYENTDAAAYAQLGQAYAQTQDYRSAVDALNRALELDPNQVQAYIYLGTAYLHLDNPATAADDFRRGLEYFPDSFDANIGMTEIYYGEGTFGTAYLQSETALAKATNDTQRALAIYWRALCQEKRDEPAAAAKDWRTLLEMPADVMTAQMRQDARDHLTSIVVPTSTARFFGPTYTPTPPPTPTFTLTPRPGNTATPAAVNTP